MSFIGDFPRAWETGIDEIDNDHRHLFKVLNEFIASDGKALPAQNRTFLDWFLAELMNHFEKEERIMKRHGYPDASDHAGHHREIFEHLGSFRHTPMTEVQMAHECQKALIRDLLVRDLAIKAFIEGQKAAS